MNLKHVILLVVAASVLAPNAMAKGVARAQHVQAKAHVAGKLKAPTVKIRKAAKIKKPRKNSKRGQTEGGAEM